MSGAAQAPHAPPEQPPLVFGDEPGDELALVPEVGSDPAPALPPGQVGRLRRRAPDPQRLAAQRARRRRRAAQRRSVRDLREGSPVLLGLLVLVGLTLLLLDLRSQSALFDAPRAATAAVLGPLQTGLDRVDPAATDAEQAAQIADLRAELAATAADRRRLAELEALLGVLGRTGHSVVGASVVAADPAGSQTVTIDRGSADGLAPDQAVLTGEGLAGKIVRTSSSTAVVRFLTDAQSAVGARLPGTGEAGIVRGTGSPGALRMELLDPVVALAAGDPVVTYGSPGSLPFPPGLLIGTVADPGDPASPRRIVTITAAAPMGRADVVAVVVTPAQPGPAPVVTVPPPAAASPPAGAAP